MSRELQIARICTGFLLNYWAQPRSVTDYVGSITAHRADDEEKHVQRFIGEPLAIDMNQMQKRQNVLIVGPMQMTNIAEKAFDGTSTFILSLDIDKQ